MGCCSSRMPYSSNEKTSKIIKYIIKNKLDKVPCSIMSEIKENCYDLQSYTKVCEDIKFKVPFNLLAIDGKVKKFDFKAAIILFSCDSSEDKKFHFDELVKNESQQIRFFEWRTQLQNERLLRQVLSDMQILDKITLELRINSYQDINDGLRILTQNNPEDFSKILSFS